MILSPLVARLLAYNTWATDRLGQWLLTIDKHVLYRPTGSSFNTVDRTLQHIWSGQEYWFEVLINQRVVEFNQPLRDQAVEQVIEDLRTSSQKLQAHFTRFTDEQLLEHIQVSDSKQSRYEYILHVVNHGTYHRGQVVSMCRSLGVQGEIPVTDYDAYLWWIENVES